MFQSKNSQTLFSGVLHYAQMIQACEVSLYNMAFGLIYSHREGTRRRVTQEHVLFISGSDIIVSPVRHSTAKWRKSLLFGSERPIIQFSTRWKIPQGFQMEKSLFDVVLC